MLESKDDNVIISDNEAFCDVALEPLPLICADIITIETSNEIKIFGSKEQRNEMFKDWALYFSEVTNPDNTAFNPHLRSKYAPLHEVLNAVRPIMGKYGLSIIQAPCVLGGDPCVKSIVIHKSGGLISFPAVSTKATKNDIQGFGGTVTYLRRFAVNAIAGVMGEVDDDGNAKASTQKVKALSKEEIDLKKILEEILKLCTEQIEKGVDKEDVYKIIADQNNGKKNPNSIKDINVAKTVLNEIKKLKTQKEESVDG